MHCCCWFWLCRAKWQQLLTEVMECLWWTELTVCHGFAIVMIRHNIVRIGASTLGVGSFYCNILWSVLFLCTVWFFCHCCLDDSPAAAAVESHPLAEPKWSHAGDTAWGAGCTERSIIHNWNFVTICITTCHVIKLQIKDDLFSGLKGRARSPGSETRHPLICRVYNGSLVFTLL